MFDADVCSGCSLPLTDDPKLSTAHIAEIHSARQERRVLHSFEATDSGFKRHRSLVEGTRNGKTDSPRIILLQCSGLSDYSLRWFLGNQRIPKRGKWQYYQWLNKDFRRDDTTFSSLWWQVQYGSISQYAHIEPRSFFSNSKSYFNALTIPMTMLALRNNQSLEKCVFPFSFAPSPYSLDNGFLLDGFKFEDSCEDLIIQAFKPDSDNHVPTVVLLRCTPQLNSDIVIGSDPWTETLFKPTKTARDDLLQAMSTSSVTLCDLISSYVCENLREASNLEYCVNLWVLAKVIPYLLHLLTFEVSSLSASLAYISKYSNDSSRSSEKQQCVHRCEQKLYSLRACIESASKQVDHLLASWDSEKYVKNPNAEWDEMEEPQASCKKLKESISHFESSYSRMHDLVMVQKTNIASDMQIDLTHRQINLTNLQIQESRQAIAQADTVAKLTILAFVFIPVSTISSIFGMNVREFVEGTRLWMFLLTTALVVGTTLVLANWGTILSLLRYWLQFEYDAQGPLRANYDSVPKIVRGPLLLWRRLSIWKKSLVMMKAEGERLRKLDQEGVS